MDELLQPLVTLGREMIVQRFADDIAERNRVLLTQESCVICANDCLHDMSRALVAPHWNNKFVAHVRVKCKQCENRLCLSCAAKLAQCDAQNADANGPVQVTCPLAKLKSLARRIRHSASFLGDEPCPACRSTDRAAWATLCGPITEGVVASMLKRMPLRCPACGDEMASRDAVLAHVESCGVRDSGSDLFLARGIRRALKSFAKCKKLRQELAVVRRDRDVAYQRLEGHLMAAQQVLDADTRDTLEDVGIIDRTSPEPGTAAAQQRAQADAADATYVDDDNNSTDDDISSGVATDDLSDVVTSDKDDDDYEKSDSDGDEAFGSDGELGVDDMPPLGSTGRQRRKRKERARGRPQVRVNTRSAPSRQSSQASVPVPFTPTFPVVRMPPSSRRPPAARRSSQALPQSRPRTRTRTR